MSGNLDQAPESWLEEQFEYEYCHECGGDAEHHDAAPFMGNWFAKCKEKVYDDPTEVPCHTAGCVYTEGHEERSGLPCRHEDGRHLS